MINKYLNTAWAVFQAPGGEGGIPPVGTPPAGGPTPPAPPAPPPAGTPPAAMPAPWGSDPNSRWLVGEKPWYESLTEGPTKDLFRTKDYANPQVAADAYYAANRMVNGNAIEVPPTDAPPEAWQGVYKKLGALDSPTEYKIEAPQGVEADPKLVEFGQTAAHKLGLNQRQAAELGNMWHEFVGKYNSDVTSEAATKTAQENAKALEGIKTKWGGEFDSLTAAGQRAFNSLFDKSKPEDMELSNKVEGAIGSAAMLELFARLGKRGGEGSFTGGGNGGGNADNVDAMTPDQARQEITRLRGGSDAEFSKAFSDAKHPGHKAAVERMNRLYAKGR